MQVDKNPIVDKNNFTFTVSNNINPQEEISISINGLMAVHKDDIVSVEGNTITVVPDLDIDWDYDSFVIIYDSI